jgi:hypothetical protein
MCPRYISKEGSITVSAVNKLEGGQLMQLTLPKEFAVFERITITGDGSFKPTAEQIERVAQEIAEKERMRNQMDLEGVRVLTPRVIESHPQAKYDGEENVECMFQCYGGKHSIMVMREAKYSQRAIAARRRDRIPDYPGHTEGLLVYL